MTWKALMEHLADRIAQALPGWSVYPHPAPDSILQGPVVEMGVGAGTIADWRLAAPGVQGTLRIALMTPTRGHPDSYYALLDAVDAVVRALHEERSVLLAQGVELGPPVTGMGPLEAPQAVAWADTSGAWRMEVQVQLRRSL